MRTALGSLAILFIAISAASAREWTDASGKYHAEAKLLGRVGSTIWLEKSNGRTAIVDLNKLSAIDRAFVEQQTAADPLTPAAPEVNPEAMNASGPQRGAKGFVRFTAAETMQPADADAEEVDQRGWRLKYIYRGCGLDAHLIIGKKPSPPGIGTVTYWHEGFHRLDGLEYSYPSADFFFYKVTIYGNGYYHWAFGRIPNCCGCYPVFARDAASHWHFKGWACRERVW